MAEELARRVAIPRTEAESACHACRTERNGEKTCTTQAGCPYQTDALLEAAAGQQRLLRRLSMLYLDQHKQLVELQKRRQRPSTAEQFGLDI